MHLGNVRHKTQENLGNLSPRFWLSLPESIGNLIQKDHVVVSKEPLVGSSTTPLFLCGFGFLELLFFATVERQ